jgi:hypothetical protein
MKKKYIPSYKELMRQQSMTNLDYLKSFIESFISHRYKQHLVSWMEEMATGKKKRYRAKNEDDLIRSVIQRLGISQFETSYATQIPEKISRQGAVDFVYQAIDGYGLETCHILSERESMHGKIWPIAAVLDDAVGHDVPVLITFIPGKIIYYESEGEIYNRGIVCIKDM